MREGSYDCQIDHSPFDVAGFVADLRNDLLWRQEIVAVEVKSGEPGQAGTEYVEDVMWEGLRAHTKLKVTEVEPGRRVRLIGQDPGLVSHFDYSFEPSGEGTHLMLSASLETIGALRLMEPFMWGLVTRWLERDLCTIGEMIPQRIGARVGTEGFVVGTSHARSTPGT